MLFDILLQVAIFLVLLFMFLFVHEVPQKLISKLRLLTRRSNLQARRHFVIGAQLLSQARSSSSDFRSLAERAAAEADKAIALDPKEAASHILKALALELLGFKTSALDSLDAALSPLAAKSLSDEERGDALFKRAELRAAVDGGGGAAVEDLVESVRLKGDNAKAYGLLGECYEKKGLIDEAQKAYENALRVQPDYVLARDSLTRLGF
ncbi:hypothetical protein MIMGU_mgv11b018096mg [Erythranthe guttata]|uniref:Uncharacterized protein n=1 Tax=Erythranthe guttata TaxID=4155 RepID=A0A022R901_ERYGU|nr:PREDICTED: uncharacterized protein LOC105958915 [Erythranthe guttata]EYU36449.1 hypothetical protein MIMGU_mgv11b018096mg [Erythranthe guttata]|eukprot:XP_012838371.1 PREDICTED: uncharacterized protein LOC105958915 [Erythranthe guttata]